MSTRPRYNALDTDSVEQLRDLAIARVTLLQSGEQHALMSGYGGPEQCFGVYWVASGGVAATYTPYCRVPPGVTEIAIEIVASGNGTIVFTSTADATGSEFVEAVVFDGTPTMDQASRTRANGSSDATEPAGRRLIVRTSVAWTWTDVQLTVVLDPTSTFDLEVYEVIYAPVHIPR